MAGHESLQPSTLGRGIDLANEDGADMLETLEWRCHDLFEGRRWSVEQKVEDIYGSMIEMERALRTNTGERGNESSCNGFENI